ncbi:exosortase-associated protein EpsI, V-type, partial [Sphingomonas bacterium]|uniref:exosortase-associated protein EpsI, V-type n=1 Tax=Sphingomonas bacterium TaxID=1895847 RepID=UPI0020C6570E
ALIGGALALAAGAGWAMQPHRTENLLGRAKLDDLVPKEFGRWAFDTASGLVLPPEDQLRDKLYSQLLTRTYAAQGGAAVMLLIAYSGAQDGTVQVHRPEVCYPASGYRLTSNEPHRVAIAPGVAVPTRAILAETEVRREQLIYWTRLGSHFPTSWAAEHSAVAAENFTGVVPDGVLVRVSSVASGVVTPMLDAFARDLYAAVGPQMRQVLLGPSAGAAIR